MALAYQRLIICLCCAVVANLSESSPVQPEDLIDDAFGDACSTLEGTSLLQTVASRQRTSAGFRYPPQDPAARTLLALDTNHDGSIDSTEINAFALAQGLDASTATQEFASIDVNGDGLLDPTELKQVLAAGPSAEQDAAPPATLQASQTAAAEEHVAEQAPIAAAPAVEQPEVAIEGPLAAAGVAVEATSAVAAPVVEAPLAEAAIAVEAPQPAAPSDTVAVETKLVSTDSAAVSQPPPTAPASAIETEELISDESRNSMREAAQLVAKELVIEENEEKEGRSLDREAAEVREKSRVAAKEAVQAALDAGAKAAHTKADSLMEKIAALEDQAQRAEVRAAALRAKAKIEREEGNQLLAAAEAALRPLV